MMKMMKGFFIFLIALFSCSLLPLHADIRADIILAPLMLAYMALVALVGLLLILLLAAWLFVVLATVLKTVLLVYRLCSRFREALRTLLPVLKILMQLGWSAALLVIRVLPALLYNVLAAVYTIVFLCKRFHEALRHLHKQYQALPVRLFDWLEGNTCGTTPSETKDQWTGNLFAGFGVVPLATALLAFIVARAISTQLCGAEADRCS
jgi:hypothetical protein